MDEVARALSEVYRLLEVELQRTTIADLIRLYDAPLARYRKETHYVRNVKNLQDKLREQLRETPQAKMMEVIAGLMDQHAALAKPEVDLMSGVTVLPDLAIHRWENEGGSVQS